MVGMWDLPGGVSVCVILRTSRMERTCIYFCLLYEICFPARRGLALLVSVKSSPVPVCVWPHFALTSFTFASTSTHHIFSCFPQHITSYLLSLVALLAPQRASRDVRLVRART